MGPIGEIWKDLRARYTRGKSGGLLLRVDLPSSSTVTPLAEQLILNGWAFSTDSPIAGVRVRVGDGPAWEAAHGGPRPDVAAAFPDAAHALMSGFAGRYSTAAITPGLHKVSVRARDVTGREAEVVLTVHVLDTAAEEARFDKLPPGLLHTTLIFLHIPKTAGSSLRRALEPVIPPDRTLLVYGDALGVSRDELGSMSPEVLARVRFVMGHFSFGIHEFFPTPARYVTILRDPVDRVVSLYRHVKRLPRNDKQAQLARENRSLAEFIEDPVLYGRNEMSRLIAGQLPSGASSEVLLETAVEHIERWFAEVLILEELRESARRLGSLLEVKLPPIPKMNVDKSARRGDVSSAVRNRIADLNAVDVALYEWARRRLTGTLH